MHLLAVLRRHPQVVAPYPRATTKVTAMTIATTMAMNTITNKLNDTENTGAASKLCAQS